MDCDFVNKLTSNKFRNTLSRRTNSSSLGSISSLKKVLLSVHSLWMKAASLRYTYMSSFNFNFAYIWYSNDFNKNNENNTVIQMFGVLRILSVKCQSLNGLNWVLH